MNKVTTVARIGKDAQVIGEKETKLLKFTCCTNVGFGEKSQAIWYDVNTFVSAAQLERAKKFVEILKKGNKVVVSGNLSTREYEGKTYLQIETSMNDIEVVEYKKAKEASSDEATPQDDAGKDDLPF